MAWKPSEVRTVDGRVCLSDSEEWRLYCEALTVIKSPVHVGGNYLGMVTSMRGAPGRQRVENEIRRIEPAYALGLPSKDERVRYLGKVEASRGTSARKALEQEILALWERQRQENAA